MFAILGSGFGLYGYLPALIELGENVVLPQAYKEKVMARPELYVLASRIHWAKDEEEAIALANALVIATPPQKQWDIVIHCLGLMNIKRVVLEKPLANTPSRASDLLESLRNSDKQFRIGYTFRHTRWFQDIPWPDLLDSRDLIEIHWNFMAHHFTNNLSIWKRLHSEGGGVLRFYGIHIIALLSYLGYENVCWCKLDGQTANEPVRLYLEVSGLNLPNCRVYIDSLSTDKRFRIVCISRQKQREILSLLHPFELEPHIVSLDDRVAVIEKLLLSFENEQIDIYNHYINVNRLWQKIEQLCGKE